VSDYLSSRLELLSRTQNPDGGWGYFVQKQTWLEPTVYAALALHGRKESQKAWDLIAQWQGPDGSWRPSEEVRVSSWSTALAVLLAAARGDSGKALQSGADWLLAQQGSDATETPAGWPWLKPGASATEPTALTVLALKKAAELKGAYISASALSQRLKSAESMLTNGEPGQKAGLVVLALQDSANPAWLDAARNLPPASPLGRAWGNLSLRVVGQKFTVQPQPQTDDILLTAIEALSDEDGNHQLLRTAGAAA
jgi:hypothetical protein